MREQSFGFCQRFGGIREAQKALIRDGLHADAFHEVCGRETAALVRPAAGREDVIAAGDVIAERLRAPRAEKNCPGGGDFLEKRRGIIGRLRCSGAKRLQKTQAASRDGASKIAPVLRMDCCAGLFVGRCDSCD